MRQEGQELAQMRQEGQETADKATGTRNGAYEAEVQKKGPQT